MRFLAGAIEAMVLLAGAVSLASADVVVSLDTSVGAPIPESAPYATATFTLNADETIGVHVSAGSGLRITWFGFNKPAGTTSSDITPAATYTGSQITSGFADADDGFCLVVTCFTDFLTDNFYAEPAPFGTSGLSFTLSRTGGFTSLSELINNGPPSPFTSPPYAANDMFGVVLTDDESNAQKYAAVGTATVPEPSSGLLLFAGVVVVATGTELRRLRRM